MSIFNLFICDTCEYYKIHRWNIHNIRIHCDCTWENEACFMVIIIMQINLVSEHANRLNAINTAKARGVYASTNDKILWVEFKCKTPKILKEQFEAIIDDTTPELLLILIILFVLVFNDRMMKTLKDLNHAQIIIRDEKLYNLPIKSEFCVSYVK